MRQALQATVAALMPWRRFTTGCPAATVQACVRIDRYLTEICQGIIDALGVEGSRIESLRSRRRPIELSADVAFPLGLIVTELVAMRFGMPSAPSGPERFGYSSDACRTVC